MSFERGLYIAFASAVSILSWNVCDYSPDAGKDGVDHWPKVGIVTAVWLGVTDDAASVLMPLVATVVHKSGLYRGDRSDDGSWPEGWPCQNIMIVRGKRCGEWRVRVFFLVDIRIFISKALQCVNMCLPMALWIRHAFVLTPSSP